MILSMSGAVLMLQRLRCLGVALKNFTADFLNILRLEHSKILRCTSSLKFQLLFIVFFL